MKSGYVALATLTLLSGVLFWRLPAIFRWIEQEERFGSPKTAEPEPDIKETQ